MKTYVVALAGALCLAVVASSAQAAPLGAASSASPTASSEVIQIHGLHTSCKLGPGGWHRSYLWGRKPCVPPHHHHHHGKKAWKKYHKKH